MNEHEEQHDSKDKEQKPVIVVGSGARSAPLLDALTALGAAGMFGGVHMMDDRIKRSESNTEARIARAGVEAKLAKEAIAAAEAKRERRRLKRLNKEKK